MFKIQSVDAHCEVPCGIYEVDTLKTAVKTCRKMIEILKGLEVDNDKEHLNQYIRAVWTKEEHARTAKAQIYMLWSDYFKPEHLEKIPNLHDVMWRAAKQCGKVKQTVSLDELAKLESCVKEVDEIFNAVK